MTRDEMHAWAKDFQNRLDTLSARADANDARLASIDMNLKTQSRILSQLLGDTH